MSSFAAFLAGLVGEPAAPLAEGAKQTKSAFKRTGGDVARMVRPKKPRGRRRRGQILARTRKRLQPVTKRLSRSAAGQAMAATPRRIQSRGARCGEIGDASAEGSGQNAQADRSPRATAGDGRSGSRQAGGEVQAGLVSQAGPEAIERRVPTRSARASSDRLPSHQRRVFRRG